MIAATERLMRVGSRALASRPYGSRIAVHGARGHELSALLAERNGFYCFESALHVFPFTDSESGLELWNAPGLWRNAYLDMAEGYFFFAEDAFGNQFCISNERILKFDAETAQTEFFTETIGEWADRILANFDECTGYDLAHEWQVKNGAIQVGDRLVPKTPFVLGGDFDIENLYSLDAVKAMQWRGDLAEQLRDLPDGAQIRLTPVE